MGKVSGFTLIELMVVIAIVGVLAGIAAPQYGHYTKRAKFSEIVVLTADRKAAVNICAQETGSLMKCSGSGTAGTYPGIPVDLPSGNGGLLAEISTTSGDISAKATTELDNHTYVLKSTYFNGRINWSRSGSCVAANLCR